MKKSHLALALIGVTTALSSCAERVDDADVVASVDGHVLTVEQAVDLLANEERLAANVGVVQSLAELWIDYTLLAAAAARDTTFEELDLEPIVMRQITQQMVYQLRDSVIQVDTFVTEDELRQRYESESPEVEVRARHIMFQLPVQSTAAQRDSVVAELEAIRARIEGGSDFATLARQVSQDRGSAALGGDLGYFRRGQMVAPFEEATLALEPGELSGVVETPMGMHLIRLDERRIQNFDQVAAEYRTRVQNEMLVEAESVFVSSIVEREQPTSVEAAFAIVRDMAGNPGARLSGRAGRRPLVEWESGALTVADLQEVLRLEAPQVREPIATGSDEDIEGLLQSLARRDLLVREAQANGLRPPADTIQALVTEAKSQLRAATRILGLLDLDQAPGEALDIAIARAVEEALRGNLTGATQVLPLGLVGFELRDGRSIAVLDAGVGQVIVDVAQIRATRGLSPLEQSQEPGPASPDTVAR